MDNYVIKRMLPNEWEEFRDARIRATKESPQAFGDTLKETLDRQKETWIQWVTIPRTYVIDVSGKFVSMATLRKDENDEWIINGVWTDPDYRRQGLNKKLFEKIFCEAKELGLEKIKLKVTTIQTPAVAMYKALGFVKIGEEKAVLSGDGLRYDQFVMEKEVK